MSYVFHPDAELYVPEPNRLLIIAAMHLHRQPDYWRNRQV
jgi:hypothetical protein